MEKEEYKIRKFFYRELAKFNKVVDFTKIRKHGIKIDEILSRL